jgi:hypothetical protein
LDSQPERWNRPPETTTMEFIDIIPLSMGFFSLKARDLWAGERV